MQSFKPSLVAAVAGVVFLLAQAAPAQQNPQTTGAARAAAGSKSATSEGAARVAPPAPAKPAVASAAKDPNSIHVEVNEVIVPVSVTDEKGRFVSDLGEKDFQVFEDNRPQTIRYFTRERNQPVVVGFLLDLSTASRIHWKNFQDATVELIQNLLTGDPRFSGYLITYGQDAELAVNTTTDPGPLVEKVRTLKPGGGAALYDAIHLACTSRRWIKGEPIEPRRVIVIVGDGHDNASKYSLNQVIELAQRNLVTIYCISTQAFGFANESDDTLVRLAQETGGRVVYPLQDVYIDTDGYLSKPSDDGNYELTVGTGAYRSVLDNKMYRSVADVVGEITTQYIIRYVSDNPNTKSYRNVKVVVDLGDVKVRARKGYYASPVPGPGNAATASSAPASP
jgi:hypothetical protein